MNELYNLFLDCFEAGHDAAKTNNFSIRNNFNQWWHKNKEYIEGFPLICDDEEMNNDGDLHDDYGNMD